MVIKDNSLFFAKVRPEAIIPSKSEENAGYDIYACVEDRIKFRPHETKLIPTGIAAAVSKDYYLQVQERGSTGSKGIKYGAGVIDSGYRGEIFIAITNASDHYLVFYDDKRTDANHVSVHEDNNPTLYPLSKAIAQLIVHRVPVMEVKEVTYEELQGFESERGTGALGSSQK